MPGTARFFAEGVFGLALVVEHLVEHTLVDERFQRPVQGHPVESFGQSLLHIRVRQSKLFAEKNAQDVFPVTGVPQLMIFQYLQLLFRFHGFFPLCLVPAHGMLSLK
jgi:hypothetical protein